PSQAPHLPVGSTVARSRSCVSPEIFGTRLLTQERANPRTETLVRKIGGIPFLMNTVAGKPSLSETSKPATRGHKEEEEQKSRNTVWVESHILKEFESTTYED